MAQMTLTLFVSLSLLGLGYYSVAGKPAHHDATVASHHVHHLPSGGDGAADVHGKPAIGGHVPTGHKNSTRTNSTKEGLSIKSRLLQVPATAAPAGHPGPALTEPATHPGPAATEPATHPGPAATVPATHPGLAATVPATHPGPAATVPATHPGLAATVPATHPGPAATVPATHPGAVAHWGYHGSTTGITPDRWALSFPTCGGMFQSPVDLPAPPYFYGQPGLPGSLYPRMGYPGIWSPMIGQPGIGSPMIGQPGIGSPIIGQPGIGSPMIGYPPFYVIAQPHLFPKFMFYGFEDMTLPWTVTNNGHTLKVEVMSMTGGLMAIGGGLPATYVMDQFHFHWPSEHTIRGRRFEMEMHVVMHNSFYGTFDGALGSPMGDGLAVLAVLFEVSYYRNQAFDSLLLELRKVQTAGSNDTFYPQRALMHLMPGNIFERLDDQEFYRYHGSLTTPPCTETVIWTIFQEPVQISYDQIEEFKSLLNSEGESMENNVRPAQPLNGRTVFFGLGEQPEQPGANEAAAGGDSGGPVVGPVFAAPAGGE